MINIYSKNCFHIYIIAKNILTILLIGDTLDNKIYINNNISYVRIIIY